MDVIKLMETARQTAEAADEAFDLAIHIAMVEAVKEISARWPRRTLTLDAGMGSCTIDVTGRWRGRPAKYLLYWDTMGGCWRLNSAWYTDGGRGEIRAPYAKIVAESALIAAITAMQDEVHRDPICYAPTFSCVGGAVVKEDV
jgi:hypothetical protein